MRKFCTLGDCFTLQQKKIRVPCSAKPFRQHPHHLLWGGGDFRWKRPPPPLLTTSNGSGQTTSKQRKLQHLGRMILENAFSMFRGAICCQHPHHLLWGRGDFRWKRPPPLLLTTSNGSGQTTSEQHGQHLGDRILERHLLLPGDRKGGV